MIISRTSPANTFPKSRNENEIILTNSAINSSNPAKVKMGFLSVKYLEKCLPAPTATTPRICTAKTDTIASTTVKLRSAAGARKSGINEWSSRMPTDPTTGKSPSQFDINIKVKTDAISGNYMLTKYMKLKREEAIDILYSIGIKDFSSLKSTKNVEGRDVFSAILPRDLNFIGTSKEKSDVIIKNGKLIEGVIDKATIGEDNGTLIRRIHAVYGKDIGIELINKIFRLGIEILLRKGFTSSISDTDLSKDVIIKNKEKLTYVENKIKEIIEEYEKRKLELLPGMDAHQTVETLILRQLNQLRDKIGENVYENVSEDNPTIIMARSGARGNFLNLAQMSAMVGQQAMGESRVNTGYKGRTLSIFKKGDLSPESKGFIKNGYKQGLTPTEFFFHSMTGRDSLMDTALRTPKSGYLYRRLANALQDMRIEYDNTVRDASGVIVQFSYGDDGLDISKTEGGKINVQRIVREVKANV